LCSGYSSEGGLRHEGHIAGPFRTKGQTSRNNPTQGRSEDGGLRVIISDKLGLASGEVTDISPGGCGLRLTKRLRLGQYLSLMVYPNDRTAAVQIDLAKVTWVAAEWAGVEFLGVSPQNHELRRLCGDQGDFPW